MEAKHYRVCGTCMVIGALILTITMLMHPSGGNLQHILRISGIIVVSHSLALFSIPFTLSGFLGLTILLRRQMLLSVNSFVLIALSMVAIVGAVVTNGHALPIVAKYVASNPSQHDLSEVVFAYNRALNYSFDMIYLVSNVLAAFLFSAAIIKTKALPQWISYVGITLASLACIAFFVGVVVTDLRIFRTFIFGNVAWIIALGIALRKIRPEADARCRQFATGDDK